MLVHQRKQKIYICRYEIETLNAGSSWHSTMRLMDLLNGKVQGD